ncbi:MAG: hypothetical protein Q9184_007595 [Pyrenodesmia sp. 2 TL-2023]
MDCFVALATLAAAVLAQTPSGCSTNSDGTFVIQPLNITSDPTQLDKRQIKIICGYPPIITLKDGVLTDQDSRTGIIDVSSQFQFDNPVQEDSLYLDGFSICGNGSVAVAGSTIFYQCLNGTTSTTVYNLYQQNQGEQCNEIYINTIACESNPADTSSSTGASTFSNVPDTITDIKPRSSTASFKGVITTAGEGIYRGGQRASATSTSTHDEFDSNPSATLATDLQETAENRLSSAAKAGVIKQKTADPVRNEQ